MRSSRAGGRFTAFPGWQDSLKQVGVHAISENSCGAWVKSTTISRNYFGTKLKVMTSAN
jgi:hypothetical protein